MLGRFSLLGRVLVQCSCGIVPTMKVRTLSDGRHPEHGKTGYTKKHAVDGRQFVTQLSLARLLSADAQHL